MRQVTQRPEHPDGVKYEFNCCPMPQVMWVQRLHEDRYVERAVCESCGMDWTEELS